MPETVNRGSQPEPDKTTPRHSPHFVEQLIKKLPFLWYTFITIVVMELINAFIPDNTLWTLAFDSLSALFIAATFFFIAFIAFRSLRNKGARSLAAKATSLGRLLGITLAKGAPWK